MHSHIPHQDSSASGDERGPEGGSAVLDHQRHHHKVCSHDVQCTALRVLCACRSQQGVLTLAQLLSEQARNLDEEYQARISAEGSLYDDIRQKLDQLFEEQGIVE